MMHHLGIQDQGGGMPDSLEVGYHSLLSGRCLTPGI
jgi:hypothetical protein